MGNSHSEGHDFKISAEQCQHPLRFNYDFDQGIHVSPNQLVFRKFDYGRAFTVSDRALMPNEILCIKVIMFHKGTLKFGITTINPDHMTLPVYENMLLNNPSALILRLLPKKSIQKDNLLFFQYTSNGEVMFGWSKKGKIREKIILIDGLVTSSPVWIALDVFGRNIALRLENELIPLLASVPSEMMKAQDLLHYSLEDITLPATARTADEGLYRANSCNQLEQVEDGLNHRSVQLPSHRMSPQSIKDFTQFFKLPLSTLEHIAKDTGNYSPTHQPIPGSSSSSSFSNRPATTDADSIFTFHTTTGTNVTLTSDKLSAWRTTGSTNAYVFTSRPIQVEETVTISITSSDPSLKKGLGFGMTVCDPASLGDLPDDGDDLLDRSEYWVYVRDVVKNVCEGNELAFSLSRRGRVSMVRAEGGTKGGEEKTLVHVDPCVHMWMFFDLTGCVKHITCLGLMKRQPIKRDTTFRNPPNNDQPDRPERLHPISFRNSVAQDPRTLETRRNSTIVSRPEIPPRPSFMKTNTFSQLPTTSSNFLSMDLPPSLAAPLIPIPPKPATLLLDKTSKNSSTQLPNPRVKLSTPPIQSSASPIGQPTDRPTSQTTTPSSTQENDFRHTHPLATQATSSSSQPVPTATISNNPGPPVNQDHNIEQLLQQITSLKAQTDKAPTDETCKQSSEPPPNSPECSICLDLPPDCVLYTCGHMCLCHACATDLINSPKPFCPICRKEIKDIVKIYRS